jgi:hypothetical protein
MYRSVAISLASQATKEGHATCIPLNNVYNEAKEAGTSISNSVRQSRGKEIM